MANNNPLAETPTRFVAAALVSVFAEFIKTVVILKDLSVEDMAIIILVAAESTKALTSDKHIRTVYGYEEQEITCMLMQFLQRSWGPHA